MIRAEGKERFSRHAAPEAVAYQLRRAKAAAARADREVQWLADLLERRTAERDAGIWPGNAIAADAADDAARAASFTRGGNS